MFAATAPIIGAVVLAGISYEVERPPTLSNVNCRWQRSSVVTRHWAVLIDMSRYQGHRITSCTPYAYGAAKPED
jgi:hypothetical protein